MEYCNFFILLDLLDYVKQIEMYFMNSHSI